MTFITKTEAKILDSNSTITALGSSGVFTGAAYDVTRYSSVTLSVYSDVDSMTHGLSIEFSSDGTNWDFTKTYMYRANSNFVSNELVQSKYIRVVYTNGATAQTALRIQTIAVPTYSGYASTPVESGTHNPNFSSNRQKVANPVSILECTHVYDDSDDLETSTLDGTGSVVYNSNHSSMELKVVANNDRAVRQSRARGIYQPGKVLNITMSGILNASSNTAGSTTRIGYFDDDNGAFFQLSSPSTYSVVLRTDTSGSVLDTDILQPNWNIDKMDGKGPSGYTLDFTKSQIFVIELEWLGVGTVRYGVILDSVIYYVHHVVNSNNTGVVYMRTPHLPVRYEALSSGGNAQLDEICYSVISDGGFDCIGRVFSMNRPTTKTIGATLTPIMSIRFKSGPKDHTLNAVLEETQLIATNNASLVFEVWMFRDIDDAVTILPGSSFIPVSSKSGMQYDVSATGVTTTNGCLIHCGFVRTGDYPISVSKLHRMSTNISGISDIIVLCSRTVNGNETITGSMSWREFGF